MTMAVVTGPNGGYQMIFWLMRFNVIEKLTIILLFVCMFMSDPIWLRRQMDVMNRDMSNSYWIIISRPRFDKIYILVESKFNRFSFNFLPQTTFYLLFNRIHSPFALLPLLIRCNKSILNNIFVCFCFCIQSIYAFE